MAKKNFTKLEKELSLALECAALCNMQSSWASWGDPSPFQEKINTLLIACGRKPTPRPTKRSPDSLKAVVSRLPKSPKTGKPLLVKGG